MLGTKMKMINAALIAGGLSIALAPPASAQRPVVIGGGLVNVQIVRLIDDVEINVQDIAVNVNAAVQIAANVCGNAVGVIAPIVQAGGDYTCDSLVEGTGAIVTIDQ